MNSLSDGALRLYGGDSKLLHTKGVDLISEFFHAVKHVFHDAWNDHTPKTSRLVHGVGIISMEDLAGELLSAEIEGFR